MKRAVIAIIAGVVVLATSLTITVNPQQDVGQNCRPARRCPSPTPTAIVNPTPTPTTAPVSTLYGASVLFALDHAARDTDAALAANLNTIRIVNFLDENCGNPYDSFRWGRVDALVAAATSRNLSVILDLSTYRNQLIGCNRNPYTTDWSPFLLFVANRYPTIKLVALAGEPNPPANSLELSSFYQRSATYWRTISLVQIESGGLLQYSYASGIDWQAIFTGVRYCSVHVYSTQDINYLPTIISWCQTNNFPFLIEEFGKPQSAGDAARASYFASMYALARQNNAVGILFWNLGPELEAIKGSETYDVNVNTPQTWSVVQTNGD